MNYQTEEEEAGLVFQEDNAPSHASRYSKGWLESKGFIGPTLMEWSPNSPDLNRIENLWSVFKRKLHLNDSKDNFWLAIQETSASLTGEEIQALTSSMDRRLLKVIKEDEGHIWEVIEEFGRTCLKNSLKHETNFFYT